MYGKKRVSAVKGRKAVGIEAKMIRIMPAISENLIITTADAAPVLLQKQSCVELKKLLSWKLAELMQESWQGLHTISNPDFSFGQILRKLVSTQMGTLFFI